MMTEQILYDIEKRNYPNKRGDAFRSLQIFECWVCQALSNHVVMGGYPGYGIRCVCPNAAECWHHKLEQKLRWKDNPHPKDYLEALSKEIEEMRRSSLDTRVNDIIGDPDQNKIRGMTNTRIITGCGCV